MKITLFLCFVFIEDEWGENMRGGPMMGPGPPPRGPPGIPRGGRGPPPMMFRGRGRGRGRGRKFQITSFHSMLSALGVL